MAAEQREKNAMPNNVQIKAVEAEILRMENLPAPASGAAGSAGAEAALVMKARGMR